MRPEGVIAAGALAQPGRLHEVVATLYGDAGGLPASYRASVMLAADLPLTAASAVDEDAPLRLLAWAASAEEVALLAAAPLRAADALLAQVTSGAGARHRTRRDDAARLDWIEPSEPSAPRERHVAVAQNHLVVGSSARAVEVCAAYLAHPPAPELQPGASALRLWLAREALARLARGAGGELSRVAGVAQLLSLLASDEAVQRLAQAREASLAADLDRDALTLRLELALAPTAEAECALGPASELGEVHAQASLALASFAREPARISGAARAASWLGEGALVPRDRIGPVGSALDRIARARGAGTRLAVELSEIGWLAYGSAELTDPELAEAALAELREALSSKAEAGARLQLVASEAVIENLGGALRLRLVPAGDGAKPVATILARVQGRRLWLATGPDPSYALRRALRDSTDDPPLSARAELAGLVGRVEASASGFFFADLAALRGQRSPAPLVASLQSCADPTVLRVAASHGAVRELAALALKGRAAP